MNYWLFGLSGAGKTTIGDALVEELNYENVVTRIDGDLLRKVVNKDLGFSPEDRAKNIDRAIALASWEASHGHITISTFITPYEALRVEAKERIPDLKLIYVRCPLYICEARDVKGLYAQARAGLITEFTGISAPFEEPGICDLIVDTAAQSIDECVKEILDAD